MMLIIEFLYCYCVLIHVYMPSFKLTANHIKIVNNELDKAKHKINRLKAGIKHRRKGVGLEKNAKHIDENRRKYMQKQDEELIKLVNTLKLSETK